MAHLMWTTSIDPQAPGSPTDSYDFMVRLSAITLWGKNIYSSFISTNASRKDMKNFHTSEVGIWVNVRQRLKAAPVPKMCNADITISVAKEI